VPATAGYATPLADGSRTSPTADEKRPRFLRLLIEGGIPPTSRRRLRRVYLGIRVRLVRHAVADRVVYRLFPRVPTVGTHIEGGTR